MKNTESIEQFLEKLNKLQLEQTETINRITELRREEELERTQDISNDELSISSSILSNEVTESDRSFNTYYQQSYPISTPRYVDKSRTKSRNTVGSGYKDRRISVNSTIKEKELNFYWKPAPPNVAPQKIFKQGTRVYITNSVTPKVPGVHDERDRRSTVIGIEYRGGDTRVIITTDNNVKTYRFPKYLGLLFVDNKQRANCKTTRYQDQYE